MQLDLDYIIENKEQLKNQKWLLVSSLQKAIRRGYDVEALNLWEALKVIDKFHATYRTSIIAIEDVGLGNFDLVKSFLSTALKKDNLISAGGDQFIANVINNLAKSVKDRTCCDLTWLASNQNWNNRLDNEYLSSFYLDSNNDIMQRVLAGWLLTGTKKIKHNCINAKDEVDNLAQFIEINKLLGVSDEVLDVVSKTYLYQKEPHIFALPLLSLALKDEAGLSFGKYKTNDSFDKNLEKNIIYVAGGIPIVSAAVDGHTSEGKRIISKLRSSALISKLINHLEVDTQEYILKHLLFKLEGGQVDRRLFYPTASSIYKRSQNFYSDGVTNLKEISSVLESFLPKINELRVQAMDYSFKPKNKNNFKV